MVGTKGQEKNYKENFYKKHLMPKTTAFDQNIGQYEQWFVKNHYVFESELLAIKKVFPGQGEGIEIGIGSGIFALPLGIKKGVEPSETMRQKAIGRGLEVINAPAEALPYDNNSIDYALMVTTICFVDDPVKSIQEASRVLKKGGSLIIGFVDNNSPLGKKYQQHKNQSVFYRDATFYSTEDLYHILQENNFVIEHTCQTIFGKMDAIKEIQEPENGYGKGGFVVIQAINN